MGIIVEDLETDVVRPSLVMLTDAIRDRLDITQSTRASISRSLPSSARSSSVKPNRRQLFR